MHQIEKRLRERFHGLVKYVLETRKFKYFNNRPTSYLKYTDPTGAVHVHSAHEGAWCVMRDCIREFEQFFDEQVTNGRVDKDEDFRKACSKFVVEIASPVGLVWEKATWLDKCDDALQPDNPKKQSMIDDMLGTIIAYCKKNERTKSTA